MNKPLRIQNFGLKLITSFCLIYFLTSCAESKNKNEPTVLSDTTVASSKSDNATDPPLAKAGFTYAYHLDFAVADIQKWYDTKGFAKLVFQPYTSDASDNSSPLKLLCYPIDDSGTIMSEQAIVLNKITNNTRPGEVSDSVIYANLQLLRSDIETLLRLAREHNPRIDSLELFPRTDVRRYFTYAILLDGSLPRSGRSELDPSPPGKAYVAKRNAKDTVSRN